MKETLYRTALVLLLLILLTPQGAWAEEEAQKPTVATIDADGVQRAEILGGSYFFKPNHIIVKVNTPVELKVMKEPGITPHDIAMKSPEAGMVFDVELGTDPKVITFIPTKEGRYPLYCTKKVPFFSSHREKGMEGVIEVVP